MAGSADFYADGQWNFFCDLCGRKEKSSIGRKTWDNFYVCARHREIRNPQDFVRGIKDNQTVPWNRPRPPDDFVKVCSVRGSVAIPGYAVPGCCIPKFINLAWIQEALPEGRVTSPSVTFAVPGLAIPAFAFPGNINHGGDDLEYVFETLPTRVVRITSKVFDGSMAIPSVAIPGLAIPGNIKYLTFLRAVP